MSSTLTRAVIAEKLAYEFELPQHQTADIFESIIDEIINSLKKGMNVKISSFGSFLIRQKNSRVGRNPKTGIEAPISARKVLSFRASQILKRQINSKLYTPTKLISSEIAAIERHSHR